MSWVRKILNALKMLIYKNICTLNLSHILNVFCISKQKRMEQGVKLKYKTKCGMQCGKILLDRKEVQQKKTLNVKML